jgi:ubiquitin-protein ligase
MNPRIRRLEADRVQMSRVFAEHPYIRIVEARGTPPDSYLLELRVKCLVPNGDAAAQVGEVHRVEVFLPMDYPRRQPLCRMTTPVFHPNIDPQKICIGDHWSAGQSLAQLVVRIAEMLAYQSYNVKSPLNAKAAAWAEQHVERLPLQTEDFGINL